MAIDTQEKRFSIMGFHNPCVTHMIPQGAIGKPGRATLMNLYSGVTLAEPVVVLDEFFIEISTDEIQVRVW